MITLLTQIIFYQLLPLLRMVSHYMQDKTLFFPSKILTHRTNICIN